MLMLYVRWIWIIRSQPITKKSTVSGRNGTKRCKSALLKSKIFGRHPFAMPPHPIERWESTLISFGARWWSIPHNHQSRSLLMFACAIVSSKSNHVLPPVHILCYFLTKHFSLCLPPVIISNTIRSDHYQHAFSSYRSHIQVIHKNLYWKWSHDKPWNESKPIVNNHRC